MRTTTRSTLARNVGAFAIAAAAVGAATLVRFLAGSWLTDPSLVFLGVVTLIAWRIGAAPAIFAVALSAFAQARFFIAPDAYLVETAEQAVSLLMWCSEAALVCVLFGAVRKAKRRSEQAEVRATAANVAKSQFLANMSHELRTPLNAILGFGELLVDDASDADRTEHVAIIRRNGKHLLGLIDAILDLSKIEAGKMSVERVACSPCGVVADVLCLLEAGARRKGLQLTVTEATSIPPEIETDPLRLRQILVNLVSNAIKFTAHGGVTITMRCADRGGAARDLLVEVADTGVGIPADKLDAIFAPFSQVDASTTRKFGGSGLGLTISRHLAEALGGSLAVTSQVDRGSTFTLAIPLTEADAQRKNVFHSSGSSPPSIFAAPA